MATKKGLRKGFLNKKKKKNKPPTTKKGKNSQCRFDSIRTSEIAKEMRMWRKELRQRESKVSLVLKFILKMKYFSMKDSNSKNK